MRRSWNRMESIPIASIDSQKELKQAINDWSEGNRHLKKLLWTCYNNNVVTSGCHSGHGKGVPYIDFDYQGSNTEKLKQIISTTLSIGNSQIFIMFGGNPRSGADWYKTVINSCPLLVKDTKRFLIGLTKATENNVEIQDESVENLLNICALLMSI